VQILQHKLGLLQYVNTLCSKNLKNSSWCKVVTSFVVMCSASEDFELHAVQLMGLLHFALASVFEYLDQM
jgi:hypothetical protein